MKLIFKKEQRFSDYYFTDYDNKQFFYYTKSNKHLYYPPKEVAKYLHKTKITTSKGKEFFPHFIKNTTYYATKRKR